MSETYPSNRIYDEAGWRFPPSQSILFEKGKTCACGEAGFSMLPCKSNLFNEYLPSVRKESDTGNQNNIVSIFEFSPLSKESSVLLSYTITPYNRSIYINERVSVNQ